MKNTLLSGLLALVVGLVVSTSVAHADDLDIYTNPTANSVKAPYTVIVLDLNLLGICNSVLTQTSNPNNPDSPQLCLNLTSSMVLSDLLGGLTSNPAAFLTTLLLGTGTTDSGRAGALCDLYGLLGLVPAIVPIPGITLALSLVLNGVTTLTCGTLEFLLGIFKIPIVGPLLSGILNGLMSGFVGQLVSGLINPLLNTVVGQLPAAIIGLLQSTLSGVLNLGQVGLLSLLESILNNLIDTNVAIMISHADRSNLTGAPGSSCNFADTASIPGTRRSTQGCSNGAYVLIGFTKLVDQGTVTTLLTKVGSLLTNTLNPTNLLNSTTAILGTALTTPTQLLPPYQGKEVYAELTHYLAGDDVYNGPLARWDGLTGLLPRDTTIELGNGNYRKPALECRTANVLNVMLTNNIRDTESDATLRSYFPGLPAGAITLSSVVAQARSPGFKDNAGRDISLKSYFLVQDLLTSTSTLANAGATVLSYVDSLGLLGLGKSAADLLKPMLVKDASLLTPSQTLDLYRPGRVLGDAFFGLFRPTDAKQPRWPGNVKKLKLKLSDNAYSYVDANNAAAIDTDGRIKTSALTYWTSTGQLGNGVTRDGRNATLGGSGQKIAGFKLGGGGDPGRNNTTGKRKLFYDSHYTGTATGTKPYLRALEETTYTAVCGASPNYPQAATLACVELTSALDAVGKESQELLLYARGYDVGTAGAASKGIGSDLVGRDWLHGAVFHSRPVAINYGARSGYTQDSPDVRVVYGAADGYFRMVDGTSGAESWAFMPRAVMKTQKVLRDNKAGGPLPTGVDGAPTVLLIDRSPTNGPGDGVIDYGNPYDKAYVFFGERRGGNGNYYDNNFYYGLDVTNPDSPRLIWRIGGIGSVGASDDQGLFNNSTSTAFRGRVQDSITYLWFTKLGMTFSAPKVGRLRLKTGATTSVDKDVLIFGGGYYGGHTTTNLPMLKDHSGVEMDAPNSAAYDAGKGKVLANDAAGEGVYIVDALTGELIWKSTALAAFTDEPGLTTVMRYDNNYRVFYHPMLQDSIAADVAVVDSDGDGFTDRLYANDTGGRLWRASLPGTDVSKWTMEPLASVGRHETWTTLAPYGYPATKANDRRFLQAPDYVPFRGPNGAYDAIVFASGDREAPLNTTTKNYLYVYRDYAINTVERKASDIVQTQSDTRLLKQASFVDLGSACADGADTCTVGKDLRNGWKIPLSGRGEKAMSQPLASNGVIFLSTYVPNDTTQSSCEASEGGSKIYAVSLVDSRPTSYLTDDASDGDKRSMVTKAPGLPGEFTPLNAMAVTANTETFVPHNRRYYDIYWRERRGDDEKQAR